ncbi:MAG: hypothetical protein IJK42_06070 [Prevotella sp.]|nr:hypothetical protein [Prevotella sp.]MBQ6209323.1 hypothetical protein [Prevotella sp.]
MKVNTELCIDLKTKLQDEVLMKPGKDYPGILRRDIPSKDFGFEECHYTFTEVSFMSSTTRRNVHLYEGQHITCTKRLNGKVRLNFKNLDENFNVDSYALEVANEIRQALGGFVER